MPTPLHVLILEDSLSDARLVVHALRQADFDVQWDRVDSEVDFLARLETPYDIILSDYSMPQFNAIKALQLLGERGLDTPFIVVSGSIGEDIAVAMLQQGAADYLLKDRLARLGDAVSRTLERKRAHEALRHSELQFRTLVERLPAATYTCDPEGRITFCNEHAIHLWGRRPALNDQADRFSRAYRLHSQTGETIAPERCWMAQVLRTGRECNGHEIVVERLDGTRRTVLVNANPIREESGKILGAVNVLVDITELRQLEQEVRQSQQRLHHVVSSSPAVLFTLGIEADRIAGVTWISENVQGLLGYSKQETYSAEWWTGNVHPDDLDTTTTTIHRDLFAHGFSAHEYRFRYRDGSYHWVRSEIRLLYDAAGRPLEAIGSWSDITERKQLEEQFRQAQKMEAIGVLAGGVAHDFNNLLTIINGYSELLLQSLRPEDPLHPPIEEIRKAGEIATGLTRQLLAFSRRQVLQPVVLDVNEVLKEMEKMLRRLIGEDIELTAHLATDLWMVKADPGQIEQVVMNIMFNARDAMPTGGKILIETKNVELNASYEHMHAQAAAGDCVLLAISDTGCGMDAKTQARIFEPFFTTKGPTKGTGLGLATVFGIVKQSGGHIEVYSELGHGTALKVFLPRDRSGEPLSPGRRSRHTVRDGSERILLVEDETAVRTFAKTILAQHGYRVVEARNGGEALLLCESTVLSFDMLITDVIMPLLSGPQLAQRLAKLQPSMKVLYMSGDTDDTVHHGMLELGTAYLQKPFAPDALVLKVREVLDAARPLAPP